jgi:beta-mannanase
MHKSISVLSLCAAALLCLGVSASATLSQDDSPPTDNRPIPYPGSWGFGAYDPGGDFSNDPTPVIEHLFLPWEDIDLSTLPAADSYARQRGRVLLITIEPWSWDQKKRVPVAVLQAGMASGKYDGNIQAVCGAIGKLQAPVTIRWAQEMEDTIGRFTWADWPPAEYIKAYQHVVDLCRPLAPKARYMWSPKGLDNLDKYYPGDAYVDDIGLSVFGLQKYDNDHFGHDRTFAEILKPGYLLVLKFKKPIYVAELGYVGDANYVSNWAHTVLKPDPQFGELVAVVYFDDKEVWPWLGNYGLPDWKVKENIVP